MFPDSIRVSARELRRVNLPHHDFTDPVLFYRNTQHGTLFSHSADRAFLQRYAKTNFLGNTMDDAVDRFRHFGAVRNLLHAFHGA